MNSSNLASTAWSCRKPCARLSLTLLWNLVLLIAIAGCHSSRVRSQYAQHFGCDPTKVQAIAPDRFAVEGCGGPATYECIHSTCALTNDAPSEEALATPVANTTKANPVGGSRPRRKKNEQGELVLVQISRFGDGTSLMLTTEPSSRNPVIEARFVSSSATFALKDCDLDWMINGQLLTAPKAKHEESGHLSALTVSLSWEFVQELGAAQLIAIRACERRLRLLPAQVEGIHEFVGMYEEELAWKGETKDGTAGMLPPSGGWQLWKPLGRIPTADIDGKNLAGTELFALLAPSVLKVEVLLSDGTSQGSAVAVSESKALTNCHVLDGARKIVVHQGDNEWVAKLSLSDPKTDRCVLFVKGATLKPVRGVRRYDDLKVGEAVFTLGSPAGLELSLADGVLSGLRATQEGPRYIQTTAPISPGSSGGGLFDIHGNLVGITTLVLTGRKQLNQSLNFAIPADSFFTE